MEQISKTVDTEMTHEQRQHCMSCARHVAESLPSSDMKNQFELAASGQNDKGLLAIHFALEHHANMVAREEAIG